MNSNFMHYVDITNPTLTNTSLIESIKLTARVKDAIYGKQLRCLLNQRYSSYTKELR